LITAFQLVIAPLLFITLSVSAVRPKWGVLVFVFLFPLINNLPYFFQIFENIPHAPTALVLFQALFLGLLLNFALRPRSISTSFNIFYPLLLVSLLILLSWLITSLRYANFALIRVQPIIELTTNVKGTTTGGALMSTTFTTLNYISGFLLFFIVIYTCSNRKWFTRILTTLSLSALITVVFGFTQHFVSLGIGNLPSKIRWESIAALNSTFKDGNSFGAFLAAYIPLALGMLLGLKSRYRFLLIPVLGGSFVLLSHTGLISGIISTSLALMLFMTLMGAKLLLKHKRKSYHPLKTTAAAGLILLIFSGTLVSVAYLSRDTSAFNKLKKRIGYLQKGESLAQLSPLKLDYYWPAALAMMRDNPVAGAGIGAYVIELSNYATLLDLPLQRDDSAENYFLQVGAELGILGLLLFLWVFWEISRHVFICVRHHRDSRGMFYIALGLASGALAMFLIFLQHTYIGSFEIKYLFWLIIGLIFGMDRLVQDKASPQRKISKTHVFAAAVLLFLFASSSVWHSSHALSLRERTQQFGLKHKFGFYREEMEKDRVFSWTQKTAGLTIHVEAPQIALQMRASHPDIGTRPVLVEFKITDDVLKNWHEYLIEIPDNYIHKDVILIISVDRIWQPYKEMESADRRKLGVAIEKIDFKGTEKWLYN
jgi:hypothetical protein